MGIRQNRYTINDFLKFTAMSQGKLDILLKNNNPIKILEYAGDMNVLCMKYGKQAKLKDIDTVQMNALGNVSYLLKKWDYAFKTWFFQQKENYRCHDIKEKYREERSRLYKKYVTERA